MRPDCMEPDEYAGWQEANLLWRRASGNTKYVGSPCADCMPAFSKEMLAIGRCNGTPGRDLIKLDHRGVKYATEEERMRARRETWRRYGLRKRAKMRALRLDSSRNEVY